MRIWNAIRRFSGIGKRVRADHSVRRAGKRQEPTLRSLINRGLRMEQFEERMLLSISPTNLAELWEVNASLAQSLENAMDLSGYSEEQLASATQWVVGLSSSDESSTFHALAANADYLTAISYLPNAAIWEFDSSIDWNTVADTLECDGKVEYFYPLVTIDNIEPFYVVNDPYFEYQWHLENTGQSGGTPGMDANVTLAWDSVLGTGVVIGIVDDGLDYNNLDLGANYRSDLSWDFARSDADPLPESSSDNHGTSVAGVAAASGDDDTGVSGAAPNAELAGLQISYELGWTDYTEAQIFTYNYQDIDIYNNSWGTGAAFVNQGPLSKAAIEDGVTNGRGGLGNIYVFSAGNSRMDLINTNHAERTNSRYTITVAAIDADGTYSWYSNRGCALFVSGYSNSYGDGIYTTDRVGEEGYNSTGVVDGDSFEDIDYTSQFGGTSSAAPLVSGVIALILEANPNLTYRDVQYILAKSASMNDPDSTGWAINGAGYHVNHDYGFGAIDAGAAVALAYDWENVSPEQVVSSGIVDVNQTIQDMNQNGVTATVEMDDSITSIEWVEVTVDIDHEWGTDLEIVLTSPSGTKSYLLEAGTTWQAKDNPLENWTLTSCFNWGESSEGTWTLQVRDLVTGDSGYFNNFELKIYGTADGTGPVIPVAADAKLELIDVIPNSGIAITEGSTQNVAPRELTLVFNDGQQIDPETISAISMKRAGGDDVFLNLNDEGVDFAYVAIGDRPNEIVIRFAETLPDDMYQLTLLGTGTSPLATLNGTAFHDGKDLTITFNLDLGAQVTAIVPQPITRDPVTNAITQHFDTIDVYFNADTLDQASAETEAFYRLTRTLETADGNDDLEIYPTSVIYDPQNNKATLTFAQNLDLYGAGTYRLRIGNEYKEIETDDMEASMVADTFSDATEISTSYLGASDGAQCIIVSSIIEPQPYDITYPGGKDDQGHRDLPTASEVEGHVGDADSTYGITTVYYCFKSDLGNGYYNYITEEQKLRAREIFDLYGDYLGIDFIEDTNASKSESLIIATGDMRAISESIPIGPGGVAGLAGDGMAIMDIFESWSSEYNGSWFNTAMHEIGHLIGLGHAYDLQGYTIMGNRDGTDTEYYVASAESMYPGLSDIIHGQYMHRPDSIDVDVYKFTLQSAGKLSAEIIAERLADSSLLDSVITIYDSNHQIIARNDDYYSEDSYVELSLPAGDYYVAISSTGNTAFDPNVLCSGEGGTSQGKYDLRLTFVSNATNYLTDVDKSGGTMLDGDGDGVPGGVYDFWFEVQSEDNTIYVDKLADATGADGTQENPFKNIDDAFDYITANNLQNRIVRIVGNRLQDFETATTKTTLSNPTDVSVGDFNKDGFADLVNVARGTDGKYYAQIYFGIDGETYKTTTTNYLVGTSPSDIKVADLNNDGADDIVVVNSGSSTISLLLNNGDGTFAPQVTRFTGTTPVEVSLGDLNGDGRLDLVVANQADNTVGVLLSNSVSFFANQVAYNVGGQPVAVMVGDVNTDGIPDVIAVRQDGTIVRLTNQGKGTFSAATTVTALGETLTAGLLGDFDNDGYYDMAVTSSGSNTLIVMTGNGDGTFDVPLQRSTGTNPVDIGVGDSDGDGYLDLFVLNQGSNDVSVFFGTGDSSLLGLAKSYTVGTTPSGLAIADIDLNGRPDIITSNSVSKTLSLRVATRDLAYEIGTKPSDLPSGEETPLDDGETMEVPKNVTVMIDAGAVFKLRGANIDVGSSAQGVDQSGGVLQVLGTPAMNVFFTSFYDKTLGIDNAAAASQVNSGDWGGLVFRSDADYDENRTVLESEGIFLNYVGCANIRYGGGQVVVNSFADTYTPIHLIETRATVTFNTITYSAGSAISADLISFTDTKYQGADFTADYERIGPEIHGNLIIENSLNALYIRINTLAGNVLENLETFARFDDTDIVHAVGENIIINENPGGPMLGSDNKTLVARLDARLAIDPGIILKVLRARIEAELGTQLIMEGTEALPIIVTSYFDNRYGIGGTFYTKPLDETLSPAAGDWSGIYVGPVSTVSIDNAVIAYGGGTSRIEGDYTDFNVIEVHQGDLRLANSKLEYNKGVTVSSNRIGRESTEASVIYLKGAQPILINNVIMNNDAPAITINANSLDEKVNVDSGRSTGFADASAEYNNNCGPLVRENSFYNNTINGMIIRGEVLSTASVWDDTDIVHVLYDEIVIPNFHTEGGLRLQSDIDESLVVKLYGSNAGFTALGTPTEITDRIGGTLQVLGMPGYPVIFTSLRDDKYGAGLDPWGQPMLNTDNENFQPGAGDWRSLKLEEYVNDRNVTVIIEEEATYGLTEGVNDIATEAQYVGQLATDEQSGDDNIRLGFDIYGFIHANTSNNPDDVTSANADADVYAFKATPGTEVWFDIDSTTLGLDTVIELIDANGQVIARSVNSVLEDLDFLERGGSALSMDRDIWNYNDVYTTSQNDAGMRVVLPGTSSVPLTYYIRVRGNGYVTQGAYQLQIRLQEAQEFSGSTVQNSSIYYATTGIELLGLPTTSPLTVGTGEMSAPEYDPTDPTARVALPATGSFLGISVASPVNTVLDGDFEIYQTALPYNGLKIFVVQDYANTGTGASIAISGGAILVKIHPGYTTQGEIVNALNGAGFTATITNPGGVVNTTGSLGRLTGGTELRVIKVGEKYYDDSWNDLISGAQDIGNVLASDQGQLEVSGYISGDYDVDWYSFQMDLTGVQSIAGVSSTSIKWPTVFDIDYANGLTGPDLMLYVFDSGGTLLYVGNNSDISDDQPDPEQYPSADDLSRGSFSTADPFIGVVNMDAGKSGVSQTYYVAVASGARVASALSQDAATQEAIESVNDIVGSYTGDFATVGDNDTVITPDSPTSLIQFEAIDYTLGDVVLFVTSGSDLYTINPYTGAVIADVTEYGTGYYLPNVTEGYSYHDLAMRSDGNLYSISTYSLSGNEDEGVYCQISTGDGSLLYSNDDNIEVFVQVKDGLVEDEREGISFEAMAYIPDDLLSAFHVSKGAYIAVGNYDGGGAAGEFTDNLLYVFDKDGNAVQHWSIIEDPDEIQVSNVVPWGQLADITVEAASEIKDGAAIAVQSEGSDYVFEYDLGLITSISGAIEDGESFVVNGTTFEFETGPYMVLDNFSNIVDGQTFTLVDENSNELTFEFDTNDDFIAGNIRINLANATTATKVGNAIRDAINAQTGASFTITATYSGGIVSFEHEKYCNSFATGISVKGTWGVTGTNTPVAIEKYMTTAQVCAKVVETVMAKGINANTSGNRIAFPDLVASQVDFENVANMTVEPESGNGVGSKDGATTIAVEILLADTANQVAVKLQSAINSLFPAPDPDDPDPPAVLTAVISENGLGNRITLENGSIGMISGLCYVGNDLYACDKLGNIFAVQNANSFGFIVPDEAPEGGVKAITKKENAGPTLVTVDNFDVIFSGLTVGPQNVEGSVYSDLLIASGTGDNPLNGSTSQVLLSIDTVGHQVPIFANGHSTIAISGLSNTTGLAFSTLDYNLWHDSSSGSGWWFGYETTPGYFPNYYDYAYSNSDVIGTYDLPGGAHGTLVTDTFSLTGYGPDEIPVLSFTYQLETDGAFGLAADNPYEIEGEPITDSVRVFITNNGVDWVLLASNVGDGLVDLIDGSGSTQQCQVNLASLLDPESPIQFDNLDNLQLKFEFSTSGSMGTGDQDRNGVLEECYLKTVSGDKIEDGDVTIVTGIAYLDDEGNTIVPQINVEYDTGFSFILPNSAGQAIADGAMLYIKQGEETFVFEFDRDGTSNPDSIVVRIDANDATFPLASKLANIINIAVGSTNPLEPFAYVIDDRIYVSTAAELSVSSDSKIAVLGEVFGTTTPGPDRVAIQVMPWTTAEEVAIMTADAINDAFLKEAYPNSEAYSSFNATVKQQGDVITFYGGYEVTESGPHGYSDENQTGDGGLSDTLRANRTRGQNRTSFVGSGDDAYWVINNNAVEQPASQYYYNLSGQDNQYDGFHLYDVSVGFLERGIDTSVGNEADFTYGEAAMPSTGDYVLTIRSGSEYYTDGIVRSFDTNDRHADEITLVIPDAGNIANHDYFTLDDGLKTQTFEFVDVTVGGSSVIPDAIKIYYSQGESGAAIANKVASAISLYGTTAITASVYSDPNYWADGSNRIDLFGCASVSGIEHIVFNTSGTAISTNIESATLFAEADFASQPGTEPADDYVTYNEGDQTLGIFRCYGSEDGLYYRQQTIAVGMSVSDIALGDVNNDGLLDLIITCNEDQCFAVALNSGNGFFTQLDIFSTGKIPSGLALGDFNRDGNTDVAISCEMENAVRIHFGNGDGTFDAGVDYAVGEAPKGIAAIDLGSDGDIDLVVTNSLSDTVTVLVNNGSGNFIDQYEVSVGHVPTIIEVIDLSDFEITEPALGVLNLGSGSVTVLINFFGNSLTALELDYDVSNYLSVSFKYYDELNLNTNMMLGDANQEKVQGYVLISGNEIIDASQYGIYYDSGTVDPYSHPGVVARMSAVENSNQLVTGIHISNNVVADAGIAGIYFSGSPYADTMNAAVPFGRILNNTLYDCNVGIMITENASPTIMNNIVANNRIGISIDSTSQTSVVICTVYQGNATNTVGIAAIDSFSRILNENDPLFVNPENNNFYLAKGSKAIDSAVDSLEDRAYLVESMQPLGIAPSPILAPEKDLYGQLRTDDPSVGNAPGSGYSQFKDCGAIDRVDFTAPTAQLIDPADNDSLGIDLDPDPNDVFIAYERVSVFSIRLSDGTTGAGIDDSTVVNNAVKIYKNGSSVPLVAGKEYYFYYDAATNVIQLYAVDGFWETGATYDIVLDNSATGIADIAGNPVSKNRLNGTTTFQISLAHFDFGDAPDPNYPTLLESDSDLGGGARHLVIGNYYLGAYITGENDANLKYDEDGVLITDAKGDAGDDGVVFSDPVLLVGQQNAEVTITASQDGGYLSAWIDFNGDGDWDDAGEKIFSNESLVEGQNTLTFDVPSLGITSVVTYARFRYSTQQDLGTTGEAPDGEVEDYQLFIAKELLDYGDAPDTYGTTFINNGARHVVTTSLYLGSNIDNEINGMPHPSALGDDNFGVYNSGTNSVTNDEDGIKFVDYLIPGELATIEVTVHGSGGFLNAWLDFNGNGAWDAGEQIATNQPVNNGLNILQIQVPADAVNGASFARFRLSTEQNLTPTGEAPNGEVEDYAVIITSQPRDFGDAPRTYMTQESSSAASALLSLPGTNNDILVLANTLGTSLNDVKFSFVNEIAYGDSANVTFNMVTRTFLIDVDPNATTAQTVINAINAEGSFTAMLDVTNDVNNNGTGLITINGVVGTTSGGYDGVGTEAASHLLGSGLALGAADVDAELDGRPSDDAQGDDSLGLDDEDAFDGLSQIQFIAGEQTTLNFQVTMGTVAEAYLNAWVDLNQDGVFSDDEQIIVGQRVYGGDNTINMIIPIIALAGDTYVRFRLSSQADLDWYGPAPDGEMEDYKIHILKGDATIQGHAFKDLNYNKVWDTSEKGHAGITVYIDQNNNGILDYSNGLPIEPYAVTMTDDLATLDIDETGYYEFSGLFAQVAPYIVRQVMPEDMLLSYPNALVALPDGSHGNSDGSYTVFLEGGETVANANFGYYNLPHLSVGDVSVVEGNKGYTNVTVPLTLTGSFGADLTFSYNTADGTATAVGSDYVTKNGTITFNAQDAPEATWSTTKLTSSGVNEYDYEADGQFVLWENHDGNDWEIYLFAGEFDSEGKPVYYQLTNNETDDHAPTLFTSKAANGTIDVIVSWTGFNSPGTDTEIFLYQAKFNADGSINVAPTIQMITDNVFDDNAPQISQNYVTWWANDGQSDEIFYYDLNTGVTRTLTDNTYSDKDPIIQGSNIVWVADKGHGNEIFLFAGKYDTQNQPIITQVTNNFINDQVPQIDGNYLVWETSEGTSSKIYLYEINTATTTLISPSFTTNRNVQISGKDIVWESKSYDWEIYYYNIDAATPAVNISNNFMAADERPEIVDGKVVWRSSDSMGEQIYYYELGGDDWPVSISDTTQSAWYPHLTDEMVVWRSHNGTNYDILIAKRNEPEFTQTVTFSVIGDTSVENDEWFGVFFQAVAGNDWVQIDDAVAEISILNDDGSLDFGDAPATYSTLLVDDGARHTISPECPARLGVNLDVEKNGFPSASSNGDDTSNTDDEDGVSFNTTLGQDTFASVTINVVVPGGGDPTATYYVDAWVDFSGDGTWNGSDEKIFESYPVTIGNNTLFFYVPADATVGLTQARFRLSSTGGLDYTGQAAGGEVEDYQVEIIAKPDFEDRTIELAGTSGNDTFIFTAGNPAVPGSNHTVSINGAIYYYLPSAIDSITFDGGAGNDTVIFNGSSATEAVELWTNRGQFTGSGYTVTTNNVEDLQAVDGNANDTVTMHGSTGNDTLVSLPTSDYATLSGTGFALRADGFKTLDVFGEGGNDQAKLYGSTGNDNYHASPSQGTMTSLGITTNAYDFRYLTGYAITGGKDTATFDDSTQNVTDTFTFSVDPTDLQSLQDQDSYVPNVRSMATMVNDLGMSLTGYNFTDVFANSNGGADQANMKGSPGIDKFWGNPTGYDPDLGETTGGSYAKLKGDYNDFSYVCTAYEFRFASASAKAGTNAASQDDVAYLYDSPGSDTLTATPVYAKITGRQNESAFYYRADYFQSVIASSKNGGEDLANLFDSAGDDTFIGDPNETKLFAKDGSYSIKAQAFEHLNARASTGYDTATLIGSSGNDVYYATPTYGKMTREGNDSNQSFYRAYFFDKVEVDADTGTNDVATFIDSEYADLLTAHGSKSENNTFASIGSEEFNPYLHEVYGFDDVKATSTSSGDKKDVADAVDFLFTEGLWTDLDD